MNQQELMNCAICIVIGFLLYSFIQNGFCGKDLVEGLCPDANANCTGFTASGNKCLGMCNDPYPTWYGDMESHHDTWQTDKFVNTCHCYGQYEHGGQCSLPSGVVSTTAADNPGDHNASTNPGKLHFCREGGRSDGRMLFNQTIDDVTITQGGTSGHTDSERAAAQTAAARTAAEHSRQSNKIG